MADVQLRGDLHPTRSAPSQSGKDVTPTSISIGRCTVISQGSVIKPPSRISRGQVHYYPMKIGDNVFVGKFFFSSFFVFFFCAVVVYLVLFYSVELMGIADCGNQVPIQRSRLYPSLRTCMWARIARLAPLLSSRRMSRSCLIPLYLQTWSLRLDPLLEVDRRE